MIKNWKFVFRAAVLAGSIAATLLAQAQTSRSVRSFDQVAISPDGNRVAWVQSAVNSSGELTGGTAIYVQDLKAASSKPRRISALNDARAASEDTLAWSPDSRHL